VKKDKYGYTIQNEILFFVTKKSKTFTQNPEAIPISMSAYNDTAKYTKYVQVYDTENQLYYTASRKLVDSKCVIKSVDDISCLVLPIQYWQVSTSGNTSDFLFVPEDYQLVR
jgi:hypothetical protein